MDSRTFPATTEQLIKVAAELKAQGFEVDPSEPTGTASAKGFNISWEITPTDITVNVLNHPWGEENIFWSRLTKLLQT
jgi:hypothetical protein